MLEAIKILGEYETAKNALGDTDQYTEKAKLKNIEKAVCFVFRKDKESITYNHTHIEDYDPIKSNRYLYKTTQHKRYDVTPTTKIKKITKGKGKEKTIDIDGVVESARKRFFLWSNTYSAEEPFILSLKETAEEKQKEIFDDFADKYKELRVYKDGKGKTIDEQANSILTIKIIEDGQERYLDEIDVFRKIFITESEKEFYYRKSFGESKGNGVCYICGNNKEVLGLLPIFSFYTVDKRGFAPEFVREDSWKRLPICNDCAKQLTIGREFLDNYLLKKFYHGFQFYIIPHFILGHPDDYLINEIKRQEKKEEYDGLLIEDDYILEPIIEKGGTFNLIFMFIKPKQGGNFDIARYVEEVPPSWIKKLDNTLNDINNLPIFKEDSLKMVGVVGKKKSGDLKNIDKRGTRIGGLVGAFFPSSKKTGVYSKYFIDIVGDILARRHISKDLVMAAFMREIRNEHESKEEWAELNEKMLALKSLMLLLFLNRLNLLKR